ncbi:MAG: hypothetical protein O3B13_25730 [Planctomycetota bacterium]|nr:hypothetical protein [Planctomycetota bacterium]
MNISISIRQIVSDTVLSSLIVMCGLAGKGLADELPVSVGSEFETRDSLAPAVDQSEDARKCVDGLCWKPDSFTVQIEAAAKDRGDWLVRFPSPVDSGDARNDRVSMEWYQARDAYQKLVTAPMVVVVHESGERYDCRTTVRAWAADSGAARLPDSPAVLRGATYRKGAS